MDFWYRLEPLEMQSTVKKGNFGSRGGHIPRVLTIPYTQQLFIHFFTMPHATFTFTRGFIQAGQSICSKAMQLVKSRF